MGLIDTIWAQYLKIAKSEIEDFKIDPLNSQWNQLYTILDIASETEWGKKFKFSSISSIENYIQSVPIHEYDDIKSDIQRMMKGEESVLWPGKVSYFAKSSGTTSDKSKFIPITKENHKYCHTKGGLRLTSVIYSEIPKPGILDGKTIVLTGSTRNDLPDFPNVVVGDVSAVIYRNLTSILKSFFVPDEESNLLEDSETKLDVIAQKCCGEDVRMLAGSPTWMLLLCKKILMLTGKQNMLEVWPNFKILVHGAVSFVPYRKNFMELFPSEKVFFWETYNASEGYFAVQDKAHSEEMLLLLDVGIFYEFILPDQLHLSQPQTCTIKDVELGKNYGLVITSNSGLYRYIVGDTIQFTSLSPHRIKITGRIKQFINVFGEELMVSNTDEAIQKTCEHFNVKVKDYTVAPVFHPDSKSQGAHEWLIEFENTPPDSNLFAIHLDKALQSLNSDYEAKRFKNLAMEMLILHVAKQGCFANWMKATGRIGAQKKVPRLSSQRVYLEEILTFNQ
ncbi:MAG: GH3 auxin-responsive promoter family protein [Saprospiraceae bacterium]|nr:GH3 auxin-responsive promoter family protein [Saprospiraceae bacterium]